jgi:hypothetical protein
MKQTILLALFICSLPVFAGGPWLVKSKSGFLELQTTQPIGKYNQLFLENGETLNLNRSALDRTYQVYLEYGLTDKLNIISSLPLKVISTHEKQTTLGNPYRLDAGNLIGLGNYKLALKYKLTDKKLNTAISVQASFNTISKDLNKGLTTGYDANYMGLYAHLGKSLTKKTYTFIDAGYNTTPSEYSDYIDIHYELGYKFKDNLTGAFTFDIRESMKDGKYSNQNLQQTGFYTNNQEYIAFGIKAAYEFKNNLGLTVAPFGGLGGNYVAKVFTFSVGVYKKW